MPNKRNKSSVNAILKAKKKITNKSTEQKKQQKPAKKKTTEKKQKKEQKKPAVVLSNERRQGAQRAQNVVNKDNQQKSGVVLAQRHVTNTKRETPKIKAAFEQKPSKNLFNDATDRDKVKKAIQDSKKVSALGTKVETKTGTYKTGAENAVTKLATSLEIRKQGQQAVEDAVSQGADRQDAQKYVDKKVGKAQKEALKQIDKENPTEIKYKYKNLTQAEYNQLALASQKGQLDTLLKSNKALAKKVGNLNVKDYVDSAGVMGFLDQMTQGLSVSQNPNYNYSKGQKQIMESQKQTGAYNFGRFAGAVAEFGLGGTGTIGSTIAKQGLKTVGKQGLKESAKQGTKQLVKTTGKNIAKETAGDTIASLPLNALDALKFSYEDGKFDKGTFAKELALNVAGDIVIGGAISGITHGLSAKQVTRFNAINKKVNSGKALTEAEQKFYSKHLKELSEKVTKALDSVEQPRGTTEIEPKDAVNTKQAIDYPNYKADTNIDESITSGENTITNRVNEPTTARTDEPTTVIKEQANIGKQVDEMRARGMSDDDILAELEKQGVDPYTAVNAVEGDIGSQVDTPKSAIERMESDVKSIDEQIKIAEENGVDTTALKEQKAQVEENLEIEKAAKKANNEVTFEEYSAQEIEKANLIKEKNELTYKLENTKNSEHYSDYIKRRGEIEDRLDEIYEAQGKQNVGVPTKKTVEEASDLGRVADGVYENEVTALGKENRRLFNDLRRLFVDTLDGFEKFAMRLPKEARETFLAQVNALRNSTNKAGGWLSESRINVDGKKTGESLTSILGDYLKPKNAKIYDEFQYYLANKHNIDRYSQGKGVFGDKITASDSVEICAHLEEKYPEFVVKAEKLNGYFKDLQQYRVDSGLISKSTADYLDAIYPNYTPTYRVMDGQRVNIADGNADVKGVIRTAKGSDAEILPLHMQVANLTQHTLKMAEQNMMYKALASAQGIKVSDIDPNVKLEDAINSMTIPTQVTDGATSKYFATFFDNGEPRKVEISQQMYRGIIEWGKDSGALADMINWKAKHIRGANALFKNLITGWNPIFGVKNIIRDTGEALIYTKNVKGFIASYPKAISAIVNKKGKYAKYFDLYQASGGKYAHIREDIATFKPSTKVSKLNPIEWCQRFNDYLEAIPRMAEFISTVDNSLGAKAIRKAGGSTDDVLAKMDRNTINKALYNANEVTLNFGRSGITTKFLNSTVVPYLNPAVQGLDKLIRTFKYAKADGAKGMLSLGAKIGAFALTPVAFNEVMMSMYGGEDYQILNTRDKDNNFFIPMGDGKFVKIPKSRVGAALSAPLDHFLRHAMYGDPMEWKQMFQGMWSNVGVMNPLDSSLFSPIALVLANKTWYGGSIESPSDLNLRRLKENEKIFDETTSAIAIKIGKKTGMSPKRIDYLIDAYTGVVGDFLIPMTAEASQGNPLFKNFIIDSVFSNKLATEFWEQSADMEARSEVKGGKATEEYETWKAKYMYDSLTINQAIQDIDSNKNLTKEQKLAKKRELKKGLNQYYKAGKTGDEISLEPIRFIASQIGADKALRKYLPKSKNMNWRDFYADYKESVGYDKLSKIEKGKASAKWLNTYSTSVDIQKRIDPMYHSTPDWETVAVANALVKGGDKIALSFGVWESTIERANNYADVNGNAKRYIVTSKAVNRAYEKLNENGLKTGTGILKKVDKSLTALSLASDKTTFLDRAYYIKNSDNKMNSARGLTSKYKWSTQEFAELSRIADTNENTYYTKQEIVDAIENSRAKDREEKAMLFDLLDTNGLKNPYGSIGDYSLKNDTGIKSEEKSTSSGSYRRGYRRRRGGSSKGKSSKMPSWEEYVKDFISSGSSTTSGVKFDKWDSPMDDAYRKKISKIIQKS